MLFVAQNSKSSWKEVLSFSLGESLFAKLRKSLKALRLELKNQ
jgi:hypothetical protein